MQNSKIILYNLSKNAKRDNYKYQRLYRLLFNKDIYNKAIENICIDAGSGVDTKIKKYQIFGGFGEDEIEKAINLLRNESYRPNPINKKSYILKKSENKKVSKKQIFRDIIIQEICRMIIEAIYEPIFLDSSHGFRKERNCHSALNNVQSTCVDVNWFIQGNIKNYFDNIDQKVLVNILKKRISDERFIRLIQKFLKNGYIQYWKYNNIYGSHLKEGVLGSLLANIYLNELDFYIEKKLKPSYAKEKIETLSTKKEQGIYYKKDSNYDNFYLRSKSIEYIRYMDNFIIGVRGSKKDCIKLKEKINSFLSDNLKLELIENKKLITNSKDFTRFLGYDIKVKNHLLVEEDENKKPKRIYNSVVQLKIPKAVIEKFIVKHNMVEDINAKQWKILHRPNLEKLSDLEIINTYNLELKELYNYYCMAENVYEKMCQLRYVMEYSCLKTLAGKYKTSVTNIKKKYRLNKDWGIKYESDNVEKVMLFYKGFKRIKNPKYINEYNLNFNEYI